MKSNTIEFDRNARTVYFAVKNVVKSCGQFSSVEGDDRLFRLKASHGLKFPPLGENIQIRVVATGTASCKVVIESSSKFALNLLNWGANQRNTMTLSDYIQNEVYRLMDVTEVKTENSASEIRIVKPVITIK